MNADKSDGRSMNLTNKIKYVHRKGRSVSFLLILRKSLGTA